MELTFGIAFIAGLISFISPCVLPLAPAYIGYLGGGITHSAAAPEIGAAVRFRTITHALFFVLGFTLVFVTIGLLSTAFVQQIGGQNISRVTGIIGRLGGVLIIFFGLHFAGIVPALFARLRARQGALDHGWVTLLAGLAVSLLIVWGFTGLDGQAQPAWVWGLAAVLIGLVWAALALGGGFGNPGAFWERQMTRIETALYSDTRRDLARPGRWGYGSSALMGVIFSAGWTPCIGPVYGAVLTMAANGGSVGQAGTLLLAYSLGLGVPFLLLSLLLEQARAALRHVQRHMRAVQLVSGIFLVIVGVLVAGGQLQTLSQQFAGDYAEFSVQLEESVLQAVTGGEAPPTAALGESAPAQPDAVVGLDVGNLAPDFSTVNVDGEPVALSDFRGQVVVLNFWATWCGPCRIEMPGFESQYRQRAADGLTILAVNNRETVEQITRFSGQLGLSFPLLLDTNGQIQTLYGILNYPSTFVIDRDGRIAARHLGVFTPAQMAQTLGTFLE